MSMCLFIFYLSRCIHKKILTRSPKHKVKVNPAPQGQATKSNNLCILASAEHNRQESKISSCHLSHVRAGNGGDNLNSGHVCY